MMRRVNLRTDLRWGIGNALAIAAVYAAWVTVVYLTQGTRPFDRQGVTYFDVVLTYFGVALLSGGMVGVFRPLASSGIGAYALGLMAGVPAALGLAVCVRGLPSNWDAADAILIPLFSIIAAIAIGREFRKSTTPLSS